MNDGPTPESIAEAVSTALRELRRLEKVYRNGAPGTGSPCHRYFAENISLGTTQASLDRMLRQTKNLLPLKEPELSEFKACIENLRVALPLGIPEPEPEPRITTGFDEFMANKEPYVRDVIQPEKNKKKGHCRIC